ncbi:3-isopropylmalate/(R)-2-methylmalate dehydratase small subunit [Pseudomonas sp. SJZ103]|uniref:3-isopropylmalate dehydratase small subunit n=1 Tax=unclassified Pseudomonas TaxID=196821 RepID=UPI0011A07970|nr:MULTISPECIES: 3-isopropylmalate dehydratase small subunit [unclassified Pseudomonas]TWC63007.1 3-isopropylmalate/(R)-2-methylmalate dehydratase small subunit [Pseudomonas sp. SJZ103]TWC80304.1 3-isopropylmalate/(R)-2-methylmalate dehydratase small subunit [Pseudomonas sp. SJZ094]
MANPFTSLNTGIVVLDQDNVDTDQIVPARFMTTLTSAGLGEALFADARKREWGKHPLDTALPDLQRILVAGSNFGCGSSREHAVWAIIDFGFQAVLAPRIADIFRNNALNNGLLAIEISTRLYANLINQTVMRITVDLEAQTIIDDAGCLETFEIDPFARYCLMQGIDRLDYLRKKQNLVLEYEKGRK